MTCGEFLIFLNLVLEEQFTTRTDELWGVYRLKRGFGGNIKRSSQTVDLVLQPLLYKALMWWIKIKKTWGGIWMTFILKF